METFCPLPSFICQAGQRAQHPSCTLREKDLQSPHREGPSRRSLPALPVGKKQISEGLGGNYGLRAEGLGVVFIDPGF